ncbi:uncharacterized protein LOC101242415 isoform X2 [Ciona intestinalis]
MDGPRNMTGLYLGGFIQEGYLPPRERKSTIPSTLYRGHVVKLARAPNSNPHRSSVGRYPMHSLNSGFAGSQVPIKDQMNFKFPRDIQRYKKYKARGKWCNHPMSIEIRKVAGAGTSGSYLAECILREDSKSASRNSAKANHFVFSQTPNATNSNIYGVSASPAFRDKDEEKFYQSMYDEIHQVVSGQQHSMQHNQHKLQRILFNQLDLGLRPDVVTPAHQKRVSTSYGFPVRHTPSTPIRRPHTTAAAPIKETKSLLLPVPFVSSHPIAVPQPPPPRPQEPIRFDPVSPWRSQLRSLTPYMMRAKAEKSYRDDHMRWNSPEPLPTHVATHGNVGESSAERVTRLLNAAAEDDVVYSSPREVPVASKMKDGFTQDNNDDLVAESDFLQRNLRLSPTASSKLSWKIENTSQISQPHSSLSVVVPASYEEPPSLPTSPLPPTTDPIIPETEMGSGATKFLTEPKRNDVTASSNGQSMTSQETDIQCVVEMTDGKKKPAAIDFGRSGGKET